MKNQLDMVLEELRIAMNQKSSLESCIKAADNHILQEQLQAECAENKELQERIKALEQQLSSGTIVKESSSPQQDALDEYTKELKKKAQYQAFEYFSSTFLEVEP
ncbi:hypothetical protein Ancab_028826 [Ancistrocladus abbreviatus]